MKKNKNTKINLKPLIVILPLVAIVTTILYWSSALRSIPTASELMKQNVDPNANVILEDNKTNLDELDLQDSETASEKTEKANGTGETAAIETSHDLAYVQQIAEETGEEMPEVSITMYALVDCGVHLEGDTESARIGNLLKGDAITVIRVGEWHTVRMDDGFEGFVYSDYLSNARPVTGETTVVEAIKEQDNLPVAVDTPVSEEPQTPAGGGDNTQTAENTPEPQQPTPQPEQTPEAPKQETANNGGGSGTISDPEIQAILQQMQDEGLGMTGGMSENVEMRVAEIDPNAAERKAAEIGLDLSNVVIH